MITDPPPDNFTLQGAGDNSQKLKSQNQSKKTPKPKIRVYDEELGFFRKKIYGKVMPLQSFSFLIKMNNSSLFYIIKILQLFKKKEIPSFSLQICFQNPFSTLLSGKTENASISPMCAFSVWPLSEVNNLFQEQIWNEKDRIFIRN